MWNYVCNVDWLQVYCKGDELNCDTYADEIFSFLVSQNKPETKLFKNVYTVYWHGKEVATVQQCPRSSAIDKRTTLVKLHNKVLYTTQYVTLLYAILKCLRLTYKGITRIDIACDCNTFYNGRSVPKFIKQYVMEPPTSPNYMYRRGSDEYYIRGNKKRNAISSFNYIRLGKKNSRVHCYIYDKTQELKDKKDKPWIREVWEKAGLVNDEETHVWRAEISIKNEGSSMLDLGTGALFHLSPSFLRMDKGIQRVFTYYARKYMDFRRKGDAKKLSNFKRVQLFNIDAPNDYLPKYVTNYIDCGRSERMCANRLNRILNTVGDLTPTETDAITITMHYLSMLSSIKKTTYQVTANQHALDSFNTYQYVRTMQYAYIDAVNRMHKKRMDVDSERVMELMGGWMTEDDWQMYIEYGRLENLLPYVDVNELPY